MKININKMLCMFYGVSIFINSMLQTLLPLEYHTINLILRCSFIIITIICFILKMKILKKINIRYCILFSISTILLFYDVIVNNTESMTLLILFFVFILSDCKERDILRYYSYGIFSTVFVTLMCWKLGIVQDLNSRGRNFIGFIFSTFGANLFLHGCIAYIAYRKDKMTILTWLILESLNLWIYIKTDTLAVFILMILVFVLYYCIKIKRISNFIQENNITKFIISHFAIIMAIFTILLQIGYNNNCNSEFWKSLNSISSGRLTCGKEAFDTIEIKLLGQKLNWIMEADNYFYLDSSYLQILFKNGLLVLILICYLMDIIEKKSLKDKNLFLILGLSILLIHSVSDPQLLSFRYNPFYMIIFPLLADRVPKNSNGDNKIYEGK